MPNNMSDWVYPVDYYFLVDFQNMYGLKFQASFFEVSNIGWRINTEEKVTDSNEAILMPKNISPQKVSLKRPVSPISDDLASWVNRCATMMYLPGGSSGVYYKKACDVVIKLLDKSGNPIAAWSCNHAYPVSYSLSALKSDSSGLTIETIELAYNRLERIK